MGIVISTSLIAFLLSCLYSKGKLKNGLKLSFCLLAFISAFRYGYGNDYFSYQVRYDYILSSFSSCKSIFLDSDVILEPGWTLLNILCAPIGYFGFIIFHALLVNYLYYRFILKHISKQWVVYAVFIYIFTSSFYLLGMSMMRQELAMAIILNTLALIQNKEVFKALFAILIAASIHQVSLIFLPFIFVGFIHLNIRKILTILLVILFVIFSINTSILQSVFSNILAIEQFEIYDVYVGAEGNSSNKGLGYIVNLIPLTLSFRYLLIKSDFYKNEIVIVLFSVMSYIIAPFNSIVPLFFRVCLFFSCFNIASYPILLQSIKNKGLRTGILLLLILYTLYTYYQFFSPSSIYHIPYSKYSTIFSKF